jgi:hypothetical protein
MTNVDRGAVADGLAAPTRLEHVLAAANRFRYSAGFRPDEWRGLTGQLPARDVYQVPVDVVGRAVAGQFAAVPVADGDTAPRLDLPFGDQAEFGPSDSVDGLLGANQVPPIGDLFGAHRAPVPDLAHTQVFPVLTDGVPDPAELTQRLPVIPRDPPFDPGQRYEPMRGVLPVPESRPRPVAPRHVPAGSAQQLMAQLRGLISDLEQDHRMRPMGAELTTLLPRITDDGP